MFQGLAKAALPTVAATAFMALTATSSPAFTLSAPSLDKLTAASNIERAHWGYGYGWHRPWGYYHRWGYWHRPWGYYHRWGYWHRPWGYYHPWAYWHRPWGYRWGYWHRLWGYRWG
jgi:hypothetical protein